ncbi:hypothetical protein LX77_00790 [Gelidibacter algens]|jgi:hypothetical protein|uniref:Uncharacterized protein n=1 Tax=Gelidibacter algens TaxID=49280 RepID=A0A1A7QYH3_9FLAO|nr:hypothetical protein [Gelidibacter algens]OBX25060.1 hypothetical protein A9996_12235 [Gelidibacter algens]RAJ26540.1 hypothetical protein LX77_00790 [Gelidibacter algens]
MNSEELFLIDKKISKNRDEVIVSFGPFDGLDQIHRFDLMMFDTIPEDIGRYDGHEVNMDDTDGRLFAYGRNAEELFKLMRPMLLQFDFLQKAMVYLRFNKEDGTHNELEFKLNQV